MSGGASKQPRQNFRPANVGLMKTPPRPQFGPDVGLAATPQRPLLPSKPGSLLNALSPKRGSMAFTKGPASLKPKY